MGAAFAGYDNDCGSRKPQIGSDVRHSPVALTAAFVAGRASQNCIRLPGSHDSKATVGLKVSVNPAVVICTDSPACMEIGPQVTAPVWVMAAEHDEIIPRAKTARCVIRSTPPRPFRLTRLVRIFQTPFSCLSVKSAIPASKGGFAGPSRQIPAATAIPGLGNYTLTTQSARFLPLAAAPSRAPPACNPQSRAAPVSTQPARPPSPRPPPEIEANAPPRQYSGPGTMYIWR